VAVSRPTLFYVATINQSINQFIYTVPYIANESVAHGCRLRPL